MQTMHPSSDGRAPGALDDDAVAARGAELARWASFLDADGPDGEDPRDEHRRDDVRAALADWADHDGAVLRYAWIDAVRRARAGEISRRVPTLLREAYLGVPASSSIGPAAADDGTIDSWREGTAAVLRPHGELDFLVATRLYEAIKESVACSDRVVVDLSRVTFIDSAALSSLLVGRRFAQRHGASLSIAGPSRACRRALDLTGLAEVLGPVDGVAPRASPG
jgi:anti-anti-sigma factor